ncbi:hypothetical protein EV175_004445 [Coemansia sp. RSA 1933]|nr:hypothetical protein EV175_004445 [Coemansia sp. RSA 1933]
MTDPQDLTPGPIEKMVIASTGVSNLFLVRRLLKESHGDESQVIELLIQWMADDPDNPDQWWAEDGRVDYAGPPQTQPTAAIAQTSGLVETDERGITETVDDADPLVDDRKPEPDNSAADKTSHPNKQPDDDDGNENSPMDMLEVESLKKRQKPVKGAARKKKAESKKRQKEMAKMKKRKAAQEEAIGTLGAGRSEEEAAQELARQINHIFI